MKKYRIICALSAVAALLSVSCSKENSSVEPQNPEEAKTVRISISGEFSDFASTKGYVESIFRMKWADNDAVYVYGTSDGATIACLGTLTATVVSDSDNRVADLSGEITAPSSGTKLTLVCSPLFSSAPSVSSGAITQSLAAQEGGAGDVTFIAYATVDYGGATTSAYRTSFKFATSVLRVNASGMDKSQALTGATISGIETSCKLTISSSAEPAVEGETSGNIVKTFTSVSTNANGNIAFYIALPVTTANTGRSLSIVETGSHTYLYPKFGSGAVETGGNMLNTIAAIPTPVKYTENSVDLGYGTFIPETGVIWAPVNCGYDADHLCGKLYQWGRMDGCGYYSSETSTTPAQDASDKVIQTVEAATWPNGGYTLSPACDKFYTSASSPNDWYTSTGTQLPKWPMAASEAPSGSSRIGNPCPTGWRVPTSDELGNLVYSNWDSSTQKGTAMRAYSFAGGYGTILGLTLPAAGYRGDSNGNAGNRGSYGFYWSSSVYGVKARFLYFYSASALMSRNNRAYGYSVRCVQE